MNLNKINRIGNELKANIGYEIKWNRARFGCFSAETEASYDKSTKDQNICRLPVQPTDSPIKTPPA